MGIVSNSQHFVKKKIKLSTIFIGPEQFNHRHLIHLRDNNENKVVENLINSYIQFHQIFIFELIAHSIQFNVNSNEYHDRWEHKTSLFDFIPICFINFMLQIDIEYLSLHSHYYLLLSYLLQLMVTTFLVDLAKIQC